MLVLTRKLQQQIKIGQQITVTILRVKGQTVRVGIEAPRDVRVIRGELPPEGAAAGAGEIEETTLLITGQEDGGSSSASVGGEPDSDVEVVISELDSAPNSRLPQRRRFNRTNHPPLRVAMNSASPSLAK
jgi:carbon storage regulator CsrA